MKTKTIRQAITFKATPREVYDMIMDSKKHESLSGQKARISKEVGGAFAAWGSHISGINLVLKPGERIVRRRDRGEPAKQPVTWTALDPSAPAVMFGKMKARGRCRRFTRACHP